MPTDGDSLPKPSPTAKRKGFLIGAVTAFGAGLFCCLLVFGGCRGRS